MDQHVIYSMASHGVGLRSSTPILIALHKFSLYQSIPCAHLAPITMLTVY